MTQTTNADPVVPYGEIPSEPDKLFVPQQLEAAVADHAPDDVDVTVNTRFRTTIARATADPDGTVKEVEISWDRFDEAEHYESNGWETAMSALNQVLDMDPPGN